MLRTAVCTQQLHIQRVFEHVLLQIFDVRKAPDTGSRNQNIDRTIGLHRKLDQSLSSSLLTSVLQKMTSKPSSFRSLTARSPFSRVELARTTFAPP